ncbi:sulfurtransferase TusA family protein [Rhodobacter ferrooxidans]|uniref:SirA family protein n=1 Tax=Rhodobacter ferrooxidans TaxID=371731 RepID=C8S4T6_9RHOB|nr:sulfurtransferase TusA family protein [Rhodobacter sp. SW2]EEW23995.1 SirA family protein [Rhodobacter sp. SW2]
MNTGVGQGEVELDCEGLLCPLPVLRARKRLLAMAPGQVLALRASDAMAAVDLPHFCAGAGHEFLGAESVGAVTVYRIRRGADQQNAGE